MERLRPPYLEQDGFYPIFYCSSIAEMGSMKPEFISASREWRKTEARSIQNKLTYDYLAFTEHTFSFLSRTEYQNPGLVYITLPLVKQNPENDLALFGNQIFIKDQSAYALIDLPGNILLHRINRLRTSMGLELLNRADLKDLHWTGNINLLNFYSKRRGDKSTLMNLDQLRIQEREETVVYEPGVLLPEGV